MHSFSTIDLLDLWERACPLAPIARPHTLISAISPDSSLDDLAQLSIGARDAALLTLREQLFGSQLAVLTDCPGCGEHLEAACTVDQLRVRQPAQPSEPLTLRQDDWEVLFRLPTCTDLDSLRSDSDVETNRGLLLERCVLSARAAEHEICARELPAEVVTALSEAMAEADPQADVQVALTCPRCGHEWHAPFDIAGFLSAELDASAQRLLQEVHDLACAYGWKETDILAMSAVRRNAYLQRVHA
jgi:hypothetical protein